MTVPKVLVAAGVVGGIAAGGTAIDGATAPEASSLTCVNQVTSWQAFNKCAGLPVRHWDAIKNSPTKYANWATAGQWSRQSLNCANVVSSGYSITWDETGGLSLGSVADHYPDDFFEKSDPVLAACDKRWEGSIRILYDQVRRNPAHKDENALQVSCLSSSGLVDRSYTEPDWEQDNEAGTWPFDEDSEAAERYRLDPLGIWYHQ